MSDRHSFDVAIVGGGAAGLAAAIFIARRNPQCSVAILDGAKKLGAKILVSGGGRCNVTNTVVAPDDFRGGSRNSIRRVLNAFTAEHAVAFFREIGVTLHEEENGKLFPDSNKARTVLDALVREAEHRGVQILTDHRVQGIEKDIDGFRIATNAVVKEASNVVMATGGLSLPKTGSDGKGYDLVKHLGHSLVPMTPALVPLILDGYFHSRLSGVAQDVEITIRIAGTKPVRLRGPLLWTHFGISGPVVMNASGLWHRAQLENQTASLSVNFIPTHTFQSAEILLIGCASGRPKVTIRTLLTEAMPTSVADAILRHIKVPDYIAMSHLSREDRRKVLHAALEWPLPVRDSRGYAYAEVTAGGVPLDEINPATMESRTCPGLYLVGEILDVDGRIGGFNFQWSWSSAYVAAFAIDKRTRKP